MSTESVGRISGDKESHQAPEGIQKSLRIIVVDDDAMINFLLGEMLEELGHSVCARANTEADAIAAASWHRPDLMIVDARLGEGSGIAAMAQITQSNLVPHLFMTGNVAWVLARVPDAVVLQKPFGEADLLRGIRQARVQAGAA